MLSGGKIPTIRSAANTGPRTSIGSIKTLGTKQLKVSKDKDGNTTEQEDTEAAKSNKQAAEKNGTETSIDTKVKKLLKDVQKAREVDGKNPDPNAPINSEKDPSRFDNVNKLEGNSKEDAAKNFGFSLPGTGGAKQNSQQQQAQASQGSSSPIGGTGASGGAGGGASGGSSGGSGGRPGSGPNTGGGISNPGNGGGGPITNPGGGGPITDPGGGGGTRTAAQIASDMTSNLSSLRNGANITIHSSDTASAQQFMAKVEASGAKPVFNEQTNTISFSSKGLTEEAMSGILAASMDNPGSIKNFDVDISKSENSGVAADIFKNMQELASLSGNNREINFDSTGDSFKIFDGDEDHGGLHGNDLNFVAQTENNQQEVEEPVRVPEFNESENQAETQMA